MKMRILIFCAVYLMHSAHTAKILGIFATATYSHHVLGYRLMEELALRGHEISFVSPYQKPQLKNFRSIVLTGFVEEYDHMMEELNWFAIGDAWAPRAAVIIGSMGPFLTDRTFGHENVQKLLHSNETFDLLIMEQFNSDAFQGFAHHFKVPSVLLSTLGPYIWTNGLVGNPAPPSYVPDLLLTYPPKMTFSQRLHNTVFVVFHTLYQHLYVYRKHDAILHKYLPDAPHLHDLLYNTSLVLLNSHFSVNAPVPHVPNMIEIGGFHVRPPEQLPQHLQKFMDDATEGVVYFSMGSNLKSKNLDPEKRIEILKAFGKLKMQVLWKWEEDGLPGRPKNVKLEKWLPQQDVLAHPNVKVFITHGGLLSSIEAVYNGVPIIGIPIYGDQKMNMANAVQGGYAITVPYDDLSEATLSAALQEIVANPRYTKNIKTRSQVMHDQQVKPLDNAVYWVEYVIRHRGAPHLRNASLDLYWYQYLLLDVILFIVFLLFVVSLMCYIITKQLSKVLTKVKQKTT